MLKFINFNVEGDDFMRIKCNFRVFFINLTLLLCVSLSSCELIQGLLNLENKTETQEQFTIPKSGLAVNKYITGKIDGLNCDITLFSKTCTFSAQRKPIKLEPRAVESSDSGSSTFEGQFVYNSQTKILYLYAANANTKYLKSNIDLSGTKGTDSKAPVSAEINSSTKTEFKNYISEVAELPLETTDDSNQQTENPETENPDTEITYPENYEPDIESPAEDAPGGKTWSTYVDGIRQLDFTKLERDEDFDTVFVPKLMPLPRPDYSAIDNKVKNLVIQSSNKNWIEMNTDSKKEEVEKDIADAANLIVKTAGAETIKEKARAIFTWIAWNINYDHVEKFKNTEITAFYDKCTMCDGFSTLMSIMCEAVNVKCDKYVGEVAGFQYADKIANVNHAWNLIYLDKKNNLYFLVDVTWASNMRETEQKSGIDNGLWDSWFDPDPCYFATSHYSDELGSQIYPKIPRSIFLKLPILEPYYERFGIDGKELLEFCYKHSISEVATFPMYERTKYPNILKVPVNAKLKRGTTYDISVETNGKIEAKAFTTDTDPANEWQNNILCNTFYVSYILVDKDYTLEETETTFKKPTFIYYDDTVSVRNDIKFTISYGNDTWYVTNHANSSGLISFSSKEKGECSAIYDARYQQWALTVPSYYANNYVYLKNMNIKNFPSSEDDLKAILRKIFTKEVDESIPLQRRGYYLYTDYNEVYIPLSKKTEAENAVLNYDYTQDKEFKEFVDWMEAHNIPSNQIDFYKEMARYPSQRGRADSFNGDTLERQRYAGDDYIAHSRLKDDNGKIYWAGGMQLYFEYRKREKRHLFRNPTIPILLVHIKDKKGRGEEVPQNFFETEQERIKSYFASAGFTNTFQTYYVEIEMDYDYFTQKYIPADLNSDEGYDMQWSWKKFDLAWEEILELASAKNPELKTLFADKNKSAMIRYFDTAELNGMWGNINGLALVHSRFDNIMENIGYSTTSHVDIFGSARKTMMPECFDSDCQRDTTVCPLCLYSFDID